MDLLDRTCDHRCGRLFFDVKDHQLANDLSDAERVFPFIYLVSDTGPVILGRFRCYNPSTCPLTRFPSRLIGKFSAAVFGALIALRARAERFLLITNEQGSLSEWTKDGDAISYLNVIFGSKVNGNDVIAGQQFRPVAGHK